VPQRKASAATNCTAQQDHLKSAWFMSRIRETMRRDSPLAPPGGNRNRMVEIDETFIGRKAGDQERGASP
jgi:hypothetical protein